MKFPAGPLASQTSHPVTVTENWRLIPASPSTQGKRAGGGWGSVAHLIVIPASRPCRLGPNLCQGHDASPPGHQEAAHCQVPDCQGTRQPGIGNRLLNCCWNRRSSDNPGQIQGSLKMKEIAKSPNCRISKKANLQYKQWTI